MGGRVALSWTESNKHAARTGRPSANPQAYRLDSRLTAPCCGWQARDPALLESVQMSPSNAVPQGWKSFSGCATRRPALDNGINRSRTGNTTHKPKWPTGAFNGEYLDAGGKPLARYPKIRPSPIWLTAEARRECRYTPLPKLRGGIGPSGIYAG